MKTICAAVCQAYELKADALKEHTNRTAVSHPRQLAIYLGYVLTNLSYPTIGRTFFMHHTTVIHAIKKMQALVETNGAVRELVADLRTQLTAPVQREMFPKPISTLFEVPGRREKRG